MSATGPIRLRRYRSLRRLSRERFAPLLNVSASMVAKLEAGITRPSLELAAKIQHLTSTWDEGAIQALEWLPVTPEATKAAS